MSDLDYDDDNDSQLVKQLRKQLEQKTKSLTEAEAALSAAQGKLTDRSLADILTAKEVNPKAAKYIRLDGVDANDEDAVAKWLDENPEWGSAKTTEETPADEQTVPDEVAEGYQQLNAAQQLQRPADLNKLDEVKRALPANATREQTREALLKAGF